MQEIIQKQNVSQNSIRPKRLYKGCPQYRLGSFVFKPNLTPQELEVLIPKKSMKLANVNTAYRFCKEEMIMVRLWLKFCTQWDHGILELGSHNYPTFFKDLKNVSMKNLLVLNVENNNINSIELIHCLDAPNLDCIYLHGNPIVSLKSLRKANFPKLSRLYINISDNEYLSEFFSSSMTLIQNLPRTRQQFEWKKFNSIRWIAKLESKKLRRVLTGKNKYAQTLDNQSIQVLSRKNKNLIID